ncbi:hypothetical protein ABC255_08720 [Neobacillus sp. 3P2-tot-E-2]|uniref:hypothetical protein n=1 Tax=Neobacillus sp. 3P2-tot-E-2 TaxID=3132212 RepID=UPI00399EF74C
MDMILELLTWILRAIVTAAVAVPLGFIIYNVMYYRFTNRKAIKELVLEYLQLANLKFDLSTSSWTREVFVENNKIENCTNYLFYPTTKAIMHWVQQNEVPLKGIKKGLKYDEYFFESIMGELLMEGRVSGIYDKETGEIKGYKFISKSV